LGSKLQLNEKEDPKEESTRKKNSERDQKDGLENETRQVTAANNFRNEKCHDVDVGQATERTGVHRKK